jgi:HSP20 family molecular chaperone IbpA
MLNESLLTDTILDCLFYSSPYKSNSNYKTKYLNYKEIEDSYVFTYALTGTEKEDIDVQLDNDYIRIKYKNEYLSKSASITEYVGKLKFDRDKSKCVYRNGLLSIYLHKSLESTAKKLSIE